MDVLLSIKPKFAMAIFSGEKKFEYRRTIFKEPVNRIIVYASSPMKMVIGEFFVNGVLFDDLGLLWGQTKQHSGISESYFYSYFSEKDKGYAIKIGHVTRYQEPAQLDELLGIKPPQSFAYVKKQFSMAIQPDLVQLPK